jgi:hypothetical protein
MSAYSSARRRSDTPAIGGAPSDGALVEVAVDGSAVSVVIDVPDPVEYELVGAPVPVVSGALVADALLLCSAPVVTAGADVASPAV